MQAFLTAAVGQSLPDEVISNLEERTEGWIASLRLAALSMRAEADHEAFVRRFRGTHSDLMDYLMAEILSRQSPGDAGIPAANVDPGSLLRAIV